MREKSNYMNNGLYCVKITNMAQYNADSKIKELFHKNYKKVILNHCKVIISKNNNNSFSNIIQKYTNENKPKKYVTIEKDEKKIYEYKCLPRKNILHIKTINHPQKSLISNTNFFSRDNNSLCYTTPKKSIVTKPLFNNYSSSFSKTACTSNENKQEKKSSFIKHNLSSENLYPKFNEEVNNQGKMINSRYHSLKEIILNKNYNEAKSKTIDEEEKMQEIKKRNERRDRETKRLLINVVKKKCPICKKLIIHYAFRIHYLSHPSQIFSWIYLGNFLNANNEEEIRQLKITYILNCAYEIKLFNLPKEIKYCHLNIIDNPKENLFQYFNKAFSFIESARTNSENILIHCKLGRSRSTSILIAYMIKYFGFTAQKAFEFIKLKRKEINPNSGFISQLYDYERYILKYQKNINYTNNDFN